MHKPDAPQQAAGELVPRALGKCPYRQAIWPIARGEKSMAQAAMGNCTGCSRNCNGGGSMEQ